MGSRALVRLPSTHGERLLSDGMEKLKMMGSCGRNSARDCVQVTIDEHLPGTKARFRRVIL